MGLGAGSASTTGQLLVATGVGTTQWQQHWDNGTLGTAVLQAPTINGQGTNSGTISGGVYGTATYQGGTANGQVIGTAVTNGAFSNGTMGNNVTIDWSKGDVQYGTLTANGTFTYSNQKAWQRLTMIFYEDGTGGRTITLPTSKYPNGVSPTFGTAASAINAVVVIYDGSNNLTQAATTFS